MKNVRVWYKKDGACRFISHLDINRTITRAFYMSGIPLWHTEGYNSRLYVSFPLPLSLGFRGTHESVDIRLLEDDYPFDQIIEGFNRYTPEGLTAYNVTYNPMKPGDISYGRFTILLRSPQHTNEEIFKAAKALLESESILTEKTTKKGVVKTVDLKESIIKYSIDSDISSAVIKIILPAGSVSNINPQLLVECIEKKCGFELFSDITRHELYTKDFKEFK